MTEPRIIVLSTGDILQIAWEKRRGIIQLVLLITVIALSALSRSATVDVQAVRPLMNARNSITAELARAKEDSKPLDTETNPPNREEGKADPHPKFQLSHHTDMLEQPNHPWHEHDLWVIRKDPLEDRGRRSMALRRIGLP
jgi:hypothetical protein